MSSLPDKRIVNCLKPELHVDLDSTHISIVDEELQDVPNVQTLFELCVQLKEKVLKLEATVRTQNNRIATLENHKTKDTVNELNISGLSGEHSKEQAEGGVPEQQLADPGTQVTPSQPADESSNNMQNENTGDGAPRQITQTPGSQGAPSQPVTNQGTTDMADSTEGGFQHTTNQRRNILRGNQGRPTVKQSDIKGSSVGNHKIQSSVRSDMGTYLIYVGRLDRETTTQMVRDHLTDIKVTDVADVINLNSRANRSEASFCISLNSEVSMNKAFKPSLWPCDVVVRPFRPPRKKQNYHRREYQGNTQRETRQNKNRIKEDGSQWNRQRNVNWTDSRWDHDSEDHRDSYGYHSYRFNDYVRRY